MKEYVLVEFVAEGSERDILLAKLELLEDEFKMQEECAYTHSSPSPIYYITGKICAQYASIIKLRDPFLAERMRISYIPDELKDKFRQ